MHCLIYEVFKSAQFLQYGDTELAYLKAKDPLLGEVIDKLGKLPMEVNPDLFCALVHCIAGQQISTKAHRTVWQRMLDGIGEITPKSIDQLTVEELQAFGINFRKARYIKNAAQKVLTGELDIDGLADLPDEEVCKQLVKLDGVAQWTAEMLLFFSMQRPNILSYGDLSIVRGMRMVYHHREITPKLFERYRRRLSPHCFIASICFIAVAEGAVEGLKDLAQKQPKETARKNLERSGRKISPGLKDFEQ